MNEKHLEYVCRLAEEAQNGREFWRAMCLAQFCAVIILNYVGWI